MAKTRISRMMTLLLTKVRIFFGVNLPAIYAPSDICIDAALFTTERTRPTSSTAAEAITTGHSAGATVTRKRLQAFMFSHMFLPKTTLPRP